MYGYGVLQSLSSCLYMIEGFLQMGTFLSRALTALSKSFRSTLPNILSGKGEYRMTFSKILIPHKVLHSFHQVTCRTSPLLHSVVHPVHFFSFP
ncbi:hypothetical protein ES332_A09G133900v1 [Gossypium tomentosum]|uniref:Uncharacterized protein n=1 Tax=Gossypium tomentosum TaxID=34277 RepID=A0A5D2P1Z6_GOSTO|nr:hypothetical protein ES332_A09G133900v1 [Gossypium tomentosum]